MDTFVGATTVVFPGHTRGGTPWSGVKGVVCTSPVHGQSPWHTRHLCATAL